MTKVGIELRGQLKIAMKFFGSEMTSRPFGNFPEIHPLWKTQASLTKVASLIANFSIVEIWTQCLGPLCLWQCFKLWLPYFGQRTCV